MHAAVSNLRPSQKEKDLFGSTVPVICMEDFVAALRDVKHDNKPRVDRNDRKRRLDHMKGSVFNKLGAAKEQQKHVGTIMTKGGYKNKSEIGSSRQGFPQTSRTTQGGSHALLQGSQGAPQISQTQRSRLPSHTGPKEYTACHDCNEVGHWKGDPECKNRKRVKFDTLGRDMDKPSSPFHCRG